MERVANACHYADVGLLDPALAATVNRDMLGRRIGRLSPKRVLEIWTGIRLV